MGPKKMFALLLAVVVPSPQLIFLPLLLPSMTLHQPTPLFADASPYRERRRRRREEEERETKKYWKEKYGYEYVQNEEDGGGGANNNNNNNNNEEGDTNRFGSASIGGLFVTQKPRDALEGIRSAFSNALRGSFFGLAALVASPIGGLKFGAGGALGGLVIGVILGVTMPIVGFVVGGYQILRGLVATPEAIVDGFIHCMVFDETKRAWMEYRLDEDMEEIKVAMKEEQTSEKKNGGGGNGRRESASSSSSRRKVKSTEYYDLLGIQTDASSSDIRSAYRKRARTVHPDKNPDDPDAEQKFRELSAAYQTLSDPAKRKKYDSSGIGVNPEQPDGGAGGPAMVDPIVFFAVLFGSEQVEPYIGELGMATAFDALLKLGSAGSPASFESWEDIKTAFGWSEAALKRRKRETEIAIHLRSRVSDYVEGFLALDAFKDSCWEEAVSIAKGGSYGASFLLAIGPALVAEANAFLGYRSSVLGSWRGPVSNAKRNLLFLRRKFAVTKSVLRTIRESLKALYESAEFLPKNDDDEATRRSRQRLEKDGTSRRKPERVVFNDKELLKDNLSNTIPTVLDMAWAINYVDISNTLYGACSKLFYDADVSAWEERLRRAEAVHILGSQFYLVGLEVTGGNTTLAGGDVDDIKARANAAFMESLKKNKEDNDEM